MIDTPTLLVLVLAVYRGTLLVTGDRITRAPRRRVRAWLRKREHDRTASDTSRLCYLLECPWCVSIYLGTIAAAVYGTWPKGWWRWPALAMAASAVAGLLATLAAPDDNDHED